MHRLLWIALMGIFSLGCAKAQEKYPVDPQTGRTIGAREITPEELKKYINQNTNSLIIDVRDPDAFAAETIKGAIHIPIDQLKANLKKIPKDTSLFFT
jgi:3-mercaptopyruvate sulfurtransferase SseA